MSSFSYFPKFEIIVILIISVDDEEREIERGLKEQFGSGSRA